MDIARRSPIPFARGRALVALALAFAVGCGNGSGGEPDDPETPSPTPTATASLIPTATATPIDAIAEGARIFFQETFDGNGRTCGTCHPAAASFTLSPEFIATLSPDDPLFVAERDPALANLENVALLRSRALILENLDGFDQPPVFRGIPHTFNMTGTAPFGWSSGIFDLRSFSSQAVHQHLPRTLSRVSGVDFREPSERELEALEQFMLSLFEPAEPVFDVAVFATTPAERRGFDLFFGEARCSSCHAGPFLTDNATFDTGITRRQASTVPPPECNPPCGALGPREEGGLRLFNTPTLFGLRNTAPYFHDNSAPTLRDAVAFYSGAEFAASPGVSFSGPIQLSDPDIDDLVAFLEALTPCGNGIADHGEPCDDGNRQIGDGCRPTCTIERCGDGIVDPGEDCDDGNGAGGDGCDGLCVRE